MVVAYAHIGVKKLTASNVVARRYVNTKRFATNVANAKVVCFASMERVEQFALSVKEPRSVHITNTARTAKNAMASRFVNTAARRAYVTTAAERLCAHTVASEICAVNVVARTSVLMAAVKTHAYHVVVRVCVSTRKLDDFVRCATPLVI